MLTLNAFRLRRTVSCSASVILLGILQVCLTTLTPVQAQNTRIRSVLPQDYWEAVNDARIAEPSEIFRNLTNITPYNNKLKRDRNNRVLFTTWTTWNGYTQSTGQQLVLTREVWVTVASDFQGFCRAYRPKKGISLAARLNQLLGLPPDDVAQAASRRVVELSVEPQFLFRPSYDPEITDREAEIGFRTSNDFISVPSDYQSWFYAQYDQRFQHEGQLIMPDSLNDNIPYPWTQLGYTYDWGDRSDWQTIDPDRPAEVGLSEFVIREGSPVLVHAVHNVDDYCRAE